MIPTEWRSVIVPILKKKRSKWGVQNGRMSWNILSTSGIQSTVWDHPSEVDRSGSREEFGGGKARRV